jgi:nucleoside-diphosphate-sugar epimerase
MAFYLVTGGAGFIGSHLVDRLLADGHRVRVLDDFSGGSRANLQDAERAAGERLQVVEGDIRDRSVLDRLVEGVDGIFHLAALGSVPRSIEEPALYHEVNGTGTLNVLLAARDAGVRRILFAGSSSVYGALEALPKREDHPTLPLSPYGLTKLIGENYLRLFRELFGMETVTLRYYNVFGPRQNPKSQYAAVIPAFVARFLAGESPVVYGDGEQSRDFTFVDDVVAANVLAMTAPAESTVDGLFNVAAGNRHSLNDMIASLREILDTTVPVVHDPPRPGDILHSQADISRVQDRLGFAPGVTFREGLERTVAYFRRQAKDGSAPSRGKTS